MSLEPVSFRRRLMAWYQRHRRDLPWRKRKGSVLALDPYHVLVSELMCQQTQVATVVPYYLRFIERLPTLAHLAAADEQEVLRLWQGLGYYSRARNLRKAAQQVAGELGGVMPSTVDELLKLPGIGRYTAGAVASLAFGRGAPVVDGNVIRVLCRLDKIETDPRQPKTLARLWQRAEELLPKDGALAGEFNSAMMELGATVCTPRVPRCTDCPVQAHCQALAAGAPQRLPLPKQSRPSPRFHREILCVCRAGSATGTRQWLMEQRPPRGRWAAMWQFITLEAGDGSLRERAEQLTGLRLGQATLIGSLAHALSHRQYQFDVYAAPAMTRRTSYGDWIGEDRLGDYPMPRPHVRAHAMVLAHLGT